MKGTPLGDTAKGCGVGAIILGILALMVLIPLGIWGGRVFFAEEIGRGNAEIEIESSSSRISNYNYFFNSCASIQTLESQIDREENRLEQTKSESERAVILTNLSALYNTRAGAVNNYNAAANKDYTQARFQDSDLPFQLNPEYVAGGTKTQCAI